MIPPDTNRVLAAIDATWPAARKITLGPWTVRDGQGGGQRVSAATLDGPMGEIAEAEDAMHALGQHPLFMVRAGEDELDAALKDAGYDVVDPVTVYLGEVTTLAKSAPPAKVIPSWPPLAVQTEIWEAGGIGADRIRVMDRATPPKTTHLGRVGDTPVGTAFTAIDGDLAMLHALEVAPNARRKGLGITMMQGAASWAKENGAEWLAVLVVATNAPANALYQRLNMAKSTGYHYRRPPA